MYEIDFHAQEKSKNIIGNNGEKYKKGGLPWKKISQKWPNFHHFWPHFEHFLLTLLRPGGALSAPP